MLDGWVLPGNHLGLLINQINSLGNPFRVPPLCCRLKEDAKDAMRLIPKRGIKSVNNSLIRSKVNGAEVSPIASPSSPSSCPN